jgi:nucleotide-binding universal stress UspA family protein
MHLYQNILCAVDFDENSLAAMTHAAQLAAEMDATLHLLHVTTIVPTVSEIVQGLELQSDLSARLRLQKTADRELLGIKHQLHTKLAFASHVPKSILSTVREVGADLIVMATHGRSGLPHLLLGSVAEAVVRNATCPVLTIRPQSGSRFHYP